MPRTYRNRFPFSIRRISREYSDTRILIPCARELTVQLLKGPGPAQTQLLPSTRRIRRPTRRCRRRKETNFLWLLLQNTLSPRAVAVNQGVVQSVDKHHAAATLLSMHPKTVHHPRINCVKIPRLLSWYTHSSSSRFTSSAADEARRLPRRRAGLLFPST